MSLLRYCLTGACAGAGMPLFGALAVKSWNRPNYRIYFRLSLVAWALCFLCAILVLAYLTTYVAIPRPLFVGCVAGGVTIGILALLLYRWRRAIAK